MDCRLYHNPACSKSRATLDLLRAHGVEPHVVEYLEVPPTVDALRELVGMLGITPRELLRTGEEAYAELGLSDPTLDDDALLRAMATHPRLMERPVFVRDGRAVIGRPPERVLDLLR